MSFENILNKKATEISRPPPVPPGTYTLQVFGRPNFVDQSRRGGTDYVDFQTKIVAIGDNVEESILATFPGGRAALMGFELKGRAGARFYLSENAMYMVKEWLTESLGIDEGDKTLKELCFEAPGNMVMAEIQNEPTQDGKGMVSTIRSWARVQ